MLFLALNVWIRHNKKNKAGFGALKLDMSKAYDRVEWAFLEAIMIKLGFARDFVELIFRCISSVSYSIRVNQSIYGRIIPQRGLRRGTLFLLTYLLSVLKGFQLFFLKRLMKNDFKELRSHLTVRLFLNYFC